MFKSPNENQIILKGSFIPKTELKNRLLKLGADLDPLDDSKITYMHIYDSLMKDYINRRRIMKELAQDGKEFLTSKKRKRSNRRRNSSKKTQFSKNNSTKITTPTKQLNYSSIYLSTRSKTKNLPEFQESELKERKVKRGEEKYDKKKRQITSKQLKNEKNSNSSTPRRQYNKRKNITVKTSGKRNKSNKTHYNLIVLKPLPTIEEESFNEKSNNYTPPYCPKSQKDNNIFINDDDEILQVNKKIKEEKKSISCSESLEEDKKLEQGNVVEPPISNNEEKEVSSAQTDSNVIEEPKPEIKEEEQNKDIQSYWFNGRELFKYIIVGSSIIILKFSIFYLVENPQKLRDFIDNIQKFEFNYQITISICVLLVLLYICERIYRKYSNKAVAKTIFSLIKQSLENQPDMRISENVIIDCYSELFNISKDIFIRNILPEIKNQVEMDQNIVILNYKIKNQNNLDEEFEESIWTLFRF